MFRMLLCAAAVRTSRPFPLGCGRTADRQSRCWQIIHDDDVAATEGWREALLDVREEDGAVHRSINHEREML